MMIYDGYDDVYIIHVYHVYAHSLFATGGR